MEEDNMVKSRYSNTLYRERQTNKEGRAVSLRELIRRC